MPTLTVIIPYFKGEEFLLSCLQSIAGQQIENNIRVQLLIIDNGTHMPNLSNIKTQIHVRTIKTKYKLGFGRAVNVGIHIAREMNSDYILIANQDTIFGDQVIQEFINHTDQFPKSFLFPFVRQLDFSPAPEWYTDKYLHGTDIDVQTEVTVEVDQQNAICFMGTASAFEVAGYFDPSYFMYHEDDDYFSRFKKKGGKLHLIKSAVVGHYFEKTSVAEAQRESHIWYRNARIRHFARYMSAYEFWRAWMRTTVGSIFKLRIKRLYMGFKHDIGMLSNLHYVRKPNDDRIKKAAKAAIIGDIISSE